MRSMKYILGGRPTNTADCLDYAMQHHPTRIILATSVAEEPTEEYFVRWLRGSFVWFFENTTVSYDVTFGGCFMHEPQARQRLSVDNANTRLEQELAHIAERVKDVAIEGVEKRFDYSAVYEEQDKRKSGPGPVRPEPL